MTNCTECGQPAYYNKVALCYNCYHRLWDRKHNKTPEKNFRIEKWRKMKCNRRLIE